MRDLDECRAEVFRRSEKRIRARERVRRRVLTVCIPAVVCAVILPAVLTNSGRSIDGDLHLNLGGMLGDKTESQSYGVAESTGNGSIDSFSFSIKWEEGSYDSASGLLTRNPSVEGIGAASGSPAAFLHLTGEETALIYDLIAEFDFSSYSGGAHENEAESTPVASLSVSADILERTVVIYESDLTGESGGRAERLLAVCRKIEELITESEEWRALSVESSALSQ